MFSFPNPCGYASQSFPTLNAQVLAVSRDAPAKLCKFRDKYGLTVRLASDEEGTVCEAFGTWVEKQNYGRTYMGIERSTVLFAADGTEQTVHYLYDARGQRIGGQLVGHHVEADDAAVAPSAHVEDQVAGRKAVHRALDDLADRAAGHRLVDLEARRIAFGVVHAAAHIGIDRQPKIFDPQLVGFLLAATGMVVGSLLPQKIGAREA